MNKLIIVGADIEIIELILDIGRYSILGIVDKQLSGKYYDFDILGDDDFFLMQKDKYISTRLVITLDDVKLREKLYEKYKANGFSFTQVISHKAMISKYATIREGAIIQNGANIGPGVSIGKLTKINVNANIMHDGEIGDFNTIAPNAVTLGYIKTGPNVFLGSNAVLLPHVKISNNVIIGAGAVVTKNLESGYIYTGCPAKKIKPISN
jgi:sugar O-acyltransferase (sialic acid O-acetyltransferase NeuD family)